MWEWLNSVYPTGASGGNAMPYGLSPSIAQYNPWNMMRPGYGSMTSPDDTQGVRDPRLSPPVASFNPFGSMSRQDNYNERDRLSPQQQMQRNLMMGQLGMQMMNPRQMFAQGQVPPWMPIGRGY